MDAINTICDCSREFIISCIRTPDEVKLPTEEVRAACRLLEKENIYPFDAEADDINLMQQINQFMNSAFVTEKRRSPVILNDGE